MARATRKGGKKQSGGLDGAGYPGFDFTSQMSKGGMVPDPSFDGVGFKEVYRKSMGGSKHATRRHGRKGTKTVKHVRRGAKKSGHKKKHTRRGRKHRGGTNIQQWANDINSVSQGIKHTFGIL